MSRTIRIKNNFKPDVCCSWKPRYVPKHMDIDYKYIPGSEVGLDDDYVYFRKVAADSKEDIWKYKKFLHGDGNASASRYSWRNDKWVRVMCNKKERRHVKEDLKIFTCGAYEDVVHETYKLSIPCWYW